MMIKSVFIRDLERKKKKGDNQKSLGEGEREKFPIYITDIWNKRKEREKKEVDEKIELGD